MMKTPPNRDSARRCATLLLTTMGWQASPCLPPLTQRATASAALAAPARHGASSRGDMALFPPPDAATQQQLGINVTGHLQDGGSRSVYGCVQLVGGGNAVVAIESTTQAAEPEAVRRLVSRPLHPNVVRGIAHLHAAGPPQRRYTVLERLQVVNGVLGFSLLSLSQ